MDVEEVGGVDLVVGSSAEDAVDVGLAQEVARVAGVELLHQGHASVVLGEVVVVYEVGGSADPFGCGRAWEFEVDDGLFGFAFRWAAIDWTTRIGERFVACGEVWSYWPPTCLLCYFRT